MAKRTISDEQLIDDLKKVASALQVDAFSKRRYDLEGSYSASVQTRRFGSWNKAVREAGLKLIAVEGVSNQELIQDLQNVAKRLGQKSLTRRQYRQYGKYAFVLPERRFGSWNRALIRAKLETFREFHVSDAKLLRDVRRVARELKKKRVTFLDYREKGAYSVGRLQDRFGLWYQVLQRAGLVPSVLSDGPLTMETLLAHADDLSRVLRALRSECPKLSSDQLWNLLRMYCSTDDFKTALEGFRKKGDLTLFQGFLSLR